VGCKNFATGLWKIPRSFNDKFCGKTLPMMMLPQPQFINVGIEKVKPK